MCEEKETGGYRYIKRNLDNPVEDYLVDVKQKMLATATTKAMKYKKIDPNLNVHRVYNSKGYIDGVFKVSDFLSHFKDRNWANPYQDKNR